MDRFVEPDNWDSFRNGLPQLEFLFDPFIPPHGVIFVHGPPGCGKSAFIWGVGNAIATGTQYLGIPTTKTRVLLLSTDMGPYELKLRWADTFAPQFTFRCMSKFDCTDPKFPSWPIYLPVQRYVQENNVGLVMIDALGGIHAGQSAIADPIATTTDKVLREWLEPAAILIVSHDKKTRYVNGVPQEAADDDFIGSQLWRANATSQIHIFKSGKDNCSTLLHTKSQVSALYPDKITLYIDEAGRAELWSEKKARDGIKKFNDAVKELKLQSVNVTAQVKAIAEFYKISTAKVWIWNRGIKNVK